MSMLRGRLELGDVPDVEALCRTVLDEQLRRYGARLAPSDHEDALAFLVAESWVLWQAYDPARGATFRTWLFWALRSRVVPEYYRQRFGRGGHRIAPEGSVSLDEIDPERGLAGLVAGGPADGAYDRSADLARLLAGGGGAQAEAVAEGRDAAAAAAPGGDRRAAGRRRRRAA